MLCLGAFSTLAQVVLTREMLVAFFGNELTIGAILCAWLISISLGAYCAKWVVDRLGKRSLAFLLPFLMLLPAILLPFQVFAIRVMRLVLRVPFGELAPLGNIVSGAFLVCLPSCFCIGFFFPAACASLAKMERGAQENDQGGVSAVYTFEALGSTAAGVALTFLLLPHFSPVRILLLAVCVALAGASCAVARRGFSISALAIAFAIAALLVVDPPFVGDIQKKMVAARWRGFGVLPSQAQSETRTVVTRLRQSIDTRYQNLAVTELEEQYALYGNGELMFVFPDPHGDEHEIHFIMAHKPTAKRILMLGGNPIGHIPEILKYNPDRLVYVEIDSGIGEIISRIRPDELGVVLSDPRVTSVIEDATHYLLNCDEVFDIAIVNAPAPTTTAANRFYTLEFFRSVERVLSSGGFIYTSLVASERLQTEAATLGATVYQTLSEVFPRVLITAEARVRFLAGGKRSGLTFDRDKLFERSKEAGIETLYFRPEYFLGADELTPSKTELARERFTQEPLPLNTTLRPLAFFHNLALWSRFSGSGVAAIFRGVSSLDYRLLVAVAAGTSVLCLLTAVGLKLGRTNSLGGASALWSRLMMGLVIGTTGFCGMALEILLIFLFQGIHGYIYARIGLVVALFMLGLVLGAPSGRWLSARGTLFPWGAMAAIEASLMLFALLVPPFVAALRGEAFIYGAVAFVGWGVGAEFPIANHLFRSVGASAGTAAAVTDASDHIGAAIGAIVVGVFLAPVLGIGSSTIVLASLKGAGILCLLSALIAGSGKHNQPAANSSTAPGRDGNV